MTLETSYDDLKEAAIKSYKESYLAKLTKYTQLPPTPKTLIGMIDYSKELTSVISELRLIKIDKVPFNPIADIESYYDELESKSVFKEKSLRVNSEKRKMERRSKHMQETKEADSYNESLITPIREKHMELLGYKDSLAYTFSHYDISPLDMSISDDITINEFSTLIDESIKACVKYSHKDNDLFNKITAPLSGQSDLVFTLGCVCLALVVIYLTLPIIAIPVFVLLFNSVHNMYKDVEKLRLASTLMSQIDYKRFVPEDSFRVVDDISYDDIDEDLEEELKSVKHYSDERDMVLKEIKEKLSKDMMELAAVREEMVEKYASTTKELQCKLNEVNNMIDELRKELVLFPHKHNTSIVMSHKYVVGRVDNVTDVEVELPLLNLVFNSANREEAINLMKLYLANALLSVRVKQVTIEIFDPINMCGDFTEFFTPETKNYIKPNNMSLDELLKTYKKYSQENIIELDGKTIDEYNQDAEKRKLTPKEYKILILVSDTKKLTEDSNKEAFSEYFKFSASSGVMIWILDTVMWANSIFVTSQYKLKGKPITYDVSIGKEAVATFADSLRNFKEDSIEYGKMFGEVYIPREKWWTFDTIKGINMPFGLENGDPSRGLNVCPVVGDANVHTILGGATGAGKSAAINQLLISLITMYPPSELVLVYIDFKNVEAAKFTAGYNRSTNEWMSTDEERYLRENGEFYSRLSRIPHLKIISGTTDGEYALSVFEFLMAEMARRQVLINKFGVTKVEEMRKQILSTYNKEHNGDSKKGTWADMRKDWNWYKPNVYDKYGDLPRLLVIFDEFQVMYNPEFVDNRTIDTINGKITAITKLARAMGAHFWFTSQSMKGTMSKDTMANFSLRGALRCTKDVSNELIGNDAAGRITQKFGYMYTNDSAGESKDANRKWRVPFLDEKDMPKYIDELNDMLPVFNEKHLLAEFYDEKILVPSDNLHMWYDTYGDKFADSSVFIIGERANYSVNKAPVTLTFLRDTGENLLLAAFDKTDLMNLIMTIVDNIKHKEDNCSILMNVQDKDMYTLLDVESIIPPDFLELAHPSFEVPVLLESLDAMISHREESENRDSLKSVYVLLVQWERAPGVSVDMNYKTGDYFKDILRRGPSVGVHFVFASADRLEMQRYVPASCNHKIVGFMPKDSSFFIETNKVEKLPSATDDKGLFALYEFAGKLIKLRIYQHKFTKTVKSREIIIE